MSTSQKRYNTWNNHLRQHFGYKVFKVSLDGGFTCPNRDGTVAFGGCTFCSESGSGDFAQSRLDPLPLQMAKGIKQMKIKWPNVDHYIAYFQNFTNTHAPVQVLRARFEQVLATEGLVGIMIATRPDCLPDETVDYLAELNQQYYLWVELGLQTIHETTSQHINRGHDYQTYLDGVAKLRQHDIRVCTHLINGLPGETYSMMMESLKTVVQESDIQGLKLHLLYLMEGAAMVRDYQTGYLQLMEKTDYVNLVCDQLEYVPADIVIHRLTGDAPRELLIGPKWSIKKWEVLNAIDQELEKRGSYQGCRC